MELGQQLLRRARVVKHAAAVHVVHGGILERDLRPVVTHLLEDDAGRVDAVKREPLRRESERGRRNVQPDQLGCATVERQAGQVITGPQP